MLVGQQEGQATCKNSGDGDVIGLLVWLRFTAQQHCLFVCLGFDGTFSTNRLYRAITVG